MYRQDIIDSKGELGEVVVINPATTSRHIQWDNLITDKNWVISLDPVTGKVKDLMKATVRKLISWYVYGRKSQKDQSAYGKWIPYERLYTACNDETHGRCV